MGAYYNAITVDDTGNTKRYSTWAVSAGSKLMEHAYSGDEYVERVISTLENSPKKLSWTCDYYEGPEYTWDKIEAEPDDVFKDNTYELPVEYIILNHTKKLLIDMKKLRCLNELRLFIIHPLPLLCNSDTESQGGGDYYPDDSRRATWNYDEIEITYDDDRKEVSDYEDVTEDVIFYE